MIETPQRVFSLAQGDCFQACVASILEVPIEDVPYNPDPTADSWFYDIQRWLAGRGMNLVHWEVTDDSGAEWSPAGYTIASVKLRGQDELHAMVALDGKLIFNPTPGKPLQGDKIVGVVGWFVFQALDPARVSRPIRVGRFNDDGPEDSRLFK